jgi:hypothetical protein
VSTASYSIIKGTDARVTIPPSSAFESNLREAPRSHSEEPRPHITCNISQRRLLTRSGCELCRGANHGMIVSFGALD